MKIEYQECEMQRDMDLIRDLLSAIENDPRLDGTNWIQPDIHQDSFGGIIGKKYSTQEIAYHLTMLVEADLVKGKTTMDMPVISKLTWQGHEFLDNIKDHDIWSKTKERIKGLPGVAIAVIMKIAEAEAMKKLGLP